MPDRATLAYVVVCLALSWAVEIGVLVGLAHLPASQLLLAVSSVMLVPALVAVVFVKLVHREALTDHGLGWRAGLGGLRVLLGAWLLTPVVTTLPLFALSYGLAGDPVHEELTAGTLLLVLLVNLPVTAIIATFTVSLGEELGWRGYLLRRLRRTMSWPKGTLVLGVIWALYHLPLILLSPTGVRPGIVAVTYSVAIIGLSAPLTWITLRARRGSVIPASLLHSALNIWNQTLIGEAALGEAGLLQTNRDHTWIFAVEGAAGAGVVVLASIPFWIALHRAERAGAELEPPRAPGAAAG